MAAIISQTQPIRAMVMDGPQAGRLVHIDSLEPQAEFSSEEQEAWNALMENSRKAANSATRLCGALDELDETLTNLKAKRLQKAAK